MPFPLNRENSRQNQKPWLPHTQIQARFSRLQPICKKLDKKRKARSENKADTFATNEDYKEISIICLQ
jgi:hypothetical protein